MFRSLRHLLESTGGEFTIYVCGGTFWTRRLLPGASRRFLCSLFARRSWVS